MAPMASRRGSASTQNTRTSTRIRSVAHAPPLAAEHVSDLERALERLRRLDALDELLPTLAEVLDVRDVFARIGEIAKRVIPHDALGLVLVSDDKQALVPHAITGTGLVVLPDRVELPAAIREYLATIGSFEIVEDIQT